MNTIDKIWELNKLIKNANPPQKKLMTIVKYKLIKQAETEGYVVKDECDEMQTIYHLLWKGVEVIHTRIPNNLLLAIEENIGELNKLALEYEVDKVLGVTTITDPGTAFLLREWKELGMAD